MKRSVRIFGWLAGLGVLLIAVLLVACVEGLDYRPYYLAPYYSSTRGRLNALTNQVVSGSLEAGFGRARLTPTVGAPAEDAAKGLFKTMPLAGYGARKGRPATGVHDELWVTAVAVRVANRVAVMVAADALIVPPEVAGEASRQLRDNPRLERGQVYFGATHSHASLGGWGQGLVAEGFAGPFNPGARTWFAGQLVAAVRAAVADLAPASVASGSFHAPGFVRNRLVGDKGKVDDEFSLLAFRQAGGKSLVMGSYAAHATVLPSSLMEFSAEYPGAWARAVEQGTGGWAAFLAGGVGSHSPVAGKPGFEGVQRMGGALAEATLRQLNGLTFTNRLILGMASVEVDLPEPHVRLADGWRLRPWLARRLVPVRERTLLQALRFDDTVWFSAPCDFSGELALRLKATLQAEGRHAVVTSFNGDYIGYVILPRYYHQGGYEPRLMSFFGPCVPEYLEDVMGSLDRALGPQG